MLMLILPFHKTNFYLEYSTNTAKIKNANVRSPNLIGNHRKIKNIITK